MVSAKLTNQVIRMCAQSSPLYYAGFHAWLGLLYYTCILSCSLFCTHQVSRVELLDEVQVKAVNVANGKNLPEVPTLMFEFIGTGQTSSFLMMNNMLKSKHSNIKQCIVNATQMLDHFLISTKKDVSEIGHLFLVFFSEATSNFVYYLLYIRSLFKGANANCSENCF